MSLPLDSELHPTHQDSSYDHLPTMNPGVIYAALAYTAWGFLPVFFKQLIQVNAFEVVMHRMVWSLVFLLCVLAVQKRWAWLRDVARQPRVLAAFAASTLLLSVNWSVYVLSLIHI